MTDQKAEEQQFNYETFEEVLEEIKKKRLRYSWPTGS